MTAHKANRLAKEANQKNNKFSSRLKEVVGYIAFKASVGEGWLYTFDLSKKEINQIKKLGYSVVFVEKTIIKVQWYPRQTQKEGK